MESIKNMAASENAFIVKYFYKSEAFIVCDNCNKRLSGELSFNLFFLTENSVPYLSRIFCRRCADVLYHETVRLSYMEAKINVKKIIIARERY
ncbi:MAG: hypothetical protein EVJ48_02680 [Candidatus Acidulodesulfobacterium acidiphilum]|uniref:Uncharacterized protein n=1 Tax=Candidatus Acidulodesulfobacterium acidiphilum TaxID=2597224 RepID=A0A520XFK2_9DELT|nr:MAG: hypothetical protein EVJ48_02680 [Candidatus Acidulodesulfobacterium acidiphilum]